MPCFQEFYIITAITMIFSEGSEWAECCQHQEEIVILQEKLLEVHSKLIDQLDRCKEQQLKIIELNKKIMNSQSHGFDTFQYQSFGQHSSHDMLKENYAQNYRHSDNHDSRQSQQTKTQLLQADLQAMRSKVLAEITEKNRLKEEIKEMRAQHKRQLSAQVKKFEGLEIILKKIQDENEQLKEKCDRARRDYRSQGELDRLANKISELQVKYMKEKQASRELQIQKRRLSGKIQELQQKLYRIEREKDKKINTQIQSVSNQQQRQIESLKYQIEKLNKNIQFREVEFKEKGQDRRKKRAFEQTKDFIKKLEEAEQNVRRHKKQQS